MDSYYVIFAAMVILILMMLVALIFEDTANRRLKAKIDELKHVNNFLDNRQTLLSKKLSNSYKRNNQLTAALRMALKFLDKNPPLSMFCVNDTLKTFSKWIESGEPSNLWGEITKDKDKLLRSKLRVEVFWMRYTNEKWDDDKEGAKFDRECKQYDEVRKKLRDSIM